MYKDAAELAKQNVDFLGHSFGAEYDMLQKQLVEALMAQRGGLDGENRQSAHATQNYALVSEFIGHLPRVRLQDIGQSGEKDSRLESSIRTDRELAMQIIKGGVIWLRDKTSDKDHIHYVRREPYYVVGQSRARGALLVPVGVDEVTQDIVDQSLDFRLTAEDRRYRYTRVGGHWIHGAVIHQRPSIRLRRLLGTLNRELISQPTADEVHTHYDVPSGQIVYRESDFGSNRFHHADLYGQHSLEKVHPAQLQIPNRDMAEHQVIHHLTQFALLAGKTELLSGLLEQHAQSAD